MKNKKIIQALNEVKPSKNEKDKMLETIFLKNRKPTVYKNYAWKFGMVSLCLVCTFLITNGFYKEDMGISPASFEPRVLMKEEHNFCYQNVCYEKVKEIKNKVGVKYLETIYDNNEEIMIYEGNQEDTIIVKRGNSYFLYQKIEREIK